MTPDSPRNRIPNGASGWTLTGFSKNPKSASRSAAAVQKILVTMNLLSGFSQLKATARQLSGSRHLEQPGRTHPAADAHRDDNKFGAAPLALDEGMPDHARARHAVRMADRDRSAIDVEPVVRDAEPVAAIEHLAGERLVQFPQINVVDLESVLLQQLGHREDRADF